MAARTVNTARWALSCSHDRERERERERERVYRMPSIKTKKHENK